jgi:hypothetical protein
MKQSKSESPLLEGVVSPQVLLASASSRRHLFPGTTFFRFIVNFLDTIHQPDTSHIGRGSHRKCMEIPRTGSLPLQNWDDQ